MSLSRRELLGAAGGLLAGSLVGGPELVALAGARAAPLVMTLTWRRRADFVELAFDLHNVTVDRSGTKFIAVDARQPSYVVVRFPSQSIAEQTSADGDPVPGLTPTRSALGSRLAFEVTDQLPYPATLAAMLDWNRFTPRVVPLARPRSAAGPGEAPRAPADTETSLEIPYRLQLSPHRDGAWAHRATPATAKDGWTELWHTRLGERDPKAPCGVSEDDLGDRTVRAIWARYPDMATWVRTPPSPAPAAPSDPAPLAMSATDRLDIVRRSLAEAPIEVDTLMLSGLGGWIVSHATWPSDRGDDQAHLTGWLHRATLGRDHYVRIAYDGYLFPFGHRATLITVSERKLVTRPGTTERAGCLRTRKFVIIRERDRDYSTAAGMPNGGREMPFTRLRSKLELTPDVETRDVPGGQLLTVGNQPFPFPWQGTDHGGRDTDFQAPAVFVMRQTAGAPSRQRAGRRRDGDPLDDLATWYRARENAEVRTATVGGLPISVAPATAEDPAATRLMVHTMALGGTVLGGAAFPSVDEFAVEMPQISALNGASQAVTTKLSYFEGYRQQGFEGAPGQVFLAVAGGTPPMVKIPGDATGVANPQMAITGISRSLGPVAGTLKNAADGRFNPAEIFGAEAKLLGDIKLSDVIPAPAAPDLGQAVKITTRDLPDGVETTMVWKPTLKPFSILEVDGGSSLELNVRMTARIGRPATHDTRGTLSGVHLRFFGEKDPALLLRVQVRTLRFTDSSGAKPDVHCDIGDVEFHGALTFVKELSSLISFGKGNGVSIVPAGDRVTVALNVAVPNLAVGLLALSNIAVHVGLVLPFDGTPVVFDASFATRENKFVLGVGILRGGGFAALSMSAQKLLSFEFAFEFGAGVSIDLGVASGCVEVMAGIHFNLSDTDHGQTIALTAYMRLRGSVSVLGLITVTVEFYLGLTYDSARNSLIGEATMTVSIDLFLFSKSVSITCRRELTRDSLPFGRQAPALASAPVRFGDVFTSDLWAQHCAAFAPA